MPVRHRLPECGFGPPTVVSFRCPVGARVVGSALVVNRWSRRPWSASIPKPNSLGSSRPLRRGITSLRIGSVRANVNSSGPSGKWRRMLAIAGSSSSAPERLSGVGAGGAHISMPSGKGSTPTYAKRSKQSRVKPGNGSLAPLGIRSKKSGLPRGRRCTSLPIIRRSRRRLRPGGVRAGASGHRVATGRLLPMNFGVEPPRSWPTRATGMPLSKR